MAADKRWYLVTYDVRDPKRLRSAARIIKGYGNRLQYSVFRCRMTGREMQRLRWELSKVLAPEDDLLMIGLCPHCVRLIEVKGFEDDWMEDVTSFEIFG